MAEPVAPPIAGTVVKPVTYADGVTQVRPGDRVSVRLFFRRRSGEVIYVPGISRRRGTYEHNGLTWVGISLADGWAVGEIVLPETGGLKKSVRFLGRGAESPDGADALKKIDAQEAEEDEADADASEAARAAGQPIERPSPRDWFAGGVAVVLQLGMYLAVFVLIAFLFRLIRNLF